MAGGPDHARIVLLTFPATRGYREGNSGTPGNPHIVLAPVDLHIMSIIQKWDLVWGEFSAARNR